jgi:uncharacterized cupin superfamily protein
VAVVVAGDGRLLSDAGAPQELGDGVVVVTPDGWTGRWEIRSTLRKVYVVVKDPAPARTAAPADG